MLLTLCFSVAYILSCCLQRLVISYAHTLRYNVETTTKITVILGIKIYHEIAVTPNPSIS